jgi:hypothetical protein
MEAVQTSRMGATLMTWALTADEFKLELFLIFMENSNMTAVHMFRFNESLFGT